MFWVKCSGFGELFLSSYGAIYPIQVQGEYTVDTGHIVAFEDTLQFRIGKAGKSLIGSFLGGRTRLQVSRSRNTLLPKS
jgi:uncharacterized protein (AIM24 family)